MAKDLQNRVKTVSFLLSIVVSLTACEEPKPDENLTDDLIEIPNEYPSEAQVASDTNEENIHVVKDESADFSAALEAEPSITMPEPKPLAEAANLEETVKAEKNEKPLLKPKKASLKKPKVKIVKVEPKQNKPEDSVLVTEVTICTKEKSGLVAYDAKNKKIVYCNDGSWHESNAGMQKALASALKKKHKKTRKLFYKVNKGAFYCTPGPLDSQSFYCSNRIEMAH